jgi:hypothetical protein
MLRRFGDRRQFVDAADDLIAERRVSWSGAWLLHPTHAFSMAKTTPTRARWSAIRDRPDRYSLGPLGQPASTSFQRNPPTWIIHQAVRTSR